MTPHANAVLSHHAVNHHLPQAEAPHKANNDNSTNAHGDTVPAVKHGQAQQQEMTTGQNLSSKEGPNPDTSGGGDTDGSGEEKKSIFPSKTVVRQDTIPCATVTDSECHDLLAMDSPRSLFALVRDASGGRSTVADANRQLDPKGTSSWNVRWYDARQAARIRIAVPQLKYCKRQSASFDPAFSTVMYKSPYKYNCLLEMAVTDDNTDSSVSSSGSTGTSPSLFCSLDACYDDLSAVDLSMAAGTVTSSRRKMKQPSPCGRPPKAAPTHTINIQNNETFLEETNQSLQEQNMPAKSTRPLRRKQQQQQEKEQASSISLKEGEHHMSAVMGPFSLNFCSYKHSGRQFRLVLNVYVRSNEDNSKAVPVCSLVSPEIVVKAKKPIKAPGSKSGGKAKGASRRKATSTPAKRVRPTPESSEAETIHPSATTTNGSASKRDSQVLQDPIKTDSLSAESDSSNISAEHPELKRRRQNHHDVSDTASTLISNYTNAEDVSFSNHQDLNTADYLLAGLYNTLPSSPKEYRQRNLTHGQQQQLQSHHSYHDYGTITQGIDHHPHVHHHLFQSSNDHYHRYHHGSLSAMMESYSHPPQQKMTTTAPRTVSEEWESLLSEHHSFDDSHQTTSALQSLNQYLAPTYRAEAGEGNVALNDNSNNSCSSNSLVSDSTCSNDIMDTSGRITGVPVWNDFGLLLEDTSSHTSYRNAPL